MLWIVIYLRNRLWYFFIYFQSPPKGATIPYRPKPQAAGGPVILAGGQAYTIQGNYAVPSAPDVSTPQFCSPPGAPPFMGAPLSPLLAPVPVSTAPSPGPPHSGHPHSAPPHFMHHIGPPQMQLPSPGQPPEHLKNGHFPGQLIIQPHLHHLQDVSAAPLFLTPGLHPPWITSAREPPPPPASHYYLSPRHHRVLSVPPPFTMYHYHYNQPITKIPPPAAPWLPHRQPCPALKSLLYQSSQ